MNRTASEQKRTDSQSPFLGAGMGWSGTLFGTG